MNYRKICFLDIDGCLTGQYGRIERKCIDLINKLGDIGTEIVVSSSWGYDNGRTAKTLIECGLKLPIIGYTKHYHEDFLCRGNEIEQWLLENFKGMATKYGKDWDGVPYYRKNRNTENREDYEFVIIDDDTDFLLGQKDNFIKINSETGITEQEIEKAIKILNRE